MSQRLPEYIEPYRLAETQRILTGALSIARMKRLVSLLASDTGDANINLVFGVDEAGQAYAAGEVQACVTMQCQRCMESMPVTVNAKVSLGFIRTETQAQGLPSHYEPFIAEEEASLLDLVEDEIILALPAVPLHEPDQCAVKAQYGGKAQYSLAGKEPATAMERQNPFAILETLRNKKER
ncbi:MAG TPA: YceD family protein [Gammaproteobacteria bacterium]